MLKQIGYIRWSGENFSPRVDKTLRIRVLAAVEKPLA